MSESKSKPILCLDFDGVIHDYLHGWKNGGEIYGNVTVGFFEWAEQASLFFRLVVLSSRSADAGGIDKMKAWLASQNGGVMPAYIEFAITKPPAFLTIDDRCVTFRGNWLMLDPAELRRFKPWMQMGGADAPEERGAAQSDAGGGARQVDAGHSEERGEGVRSS